MPSKENTHKPFKTNAPFGVQSIRFESIGFHPSLDPTGCMSKNKNQLGPGQYDPTDFECAYKKYNTSGSRWTREKEVEEFSTNLGYRNADILQRRKVEKSFRGPGYYDIDENVYKKFPASAMYNVSFGRQKRFGKSAYNNNPPPGTYSKDQSKPSCITNQWTYLPSFEWDGFLDRLRSDAPAYRKPPNLYDPKFPGTTEALLSKVVSKRGPYDCFTGPRDGTTIKNHFAPSTFGGPENWFNTWPTPLDELLTHPRYKGNGKFFHERRFGRIVPRHLLNDLCLCYREPSEPSPCTYNVQTKHKAKKNKYAFNKSVKYARPLEKWLIYPGIGRYNPKPIKCPQKCPNEESWMFKSKIGRPEFKAVEYNAF